MKLFIYYTNSGNGDKVSEVLKSKGYDIRKIIPKKRLPKGKFLSILVGGYRVTRNYKDELIDFDNNINKYDEIVIGSPIWADKLSTPINSALDSLKLDNKKVTFVLYSGSGSCKKAQEQIYELYPKANIINLKQPKDNIDELNKLEVL